MIDAPEKPFVFHSLNDDRHNEVRNEALHACSRAEVTERLSKLGIKQLYFPHLVTTKPNGPHVPILAPPPDVLKTRKRVIVVVNDASQDLGILAYRQLQRELGLNGGSVINFAKEIIRRSAVAKNDEGSCNTTDIFHDGAGVQDDSDIPGLIVMNTGQLLYSHRYNRSMTMRSWCAMPRKSIAHDPIKIHDQENYIEGHRTPTEHIRSVFDLLLCNPDRIAPDAEVYIIAIEGGADKVLDVFKKDFDKYGSRVTAMAIVHSLVDNSEITHPSLKAFLHQRTRQWKYTDLSSDPGQCVDLPDDYSSDASSQTASKGAKSIHWNEEILRSGSLSEVTKTMHRLALNIVSPTDDDNNKTAPTEPDTKASAEWTGGSVLCPTFAGADEPAGECIMTNPTVQHAILSFFDQVAHDPAHYRNPPFLTFTDPPRPTADAPFALSAVPEASDMQSAIPLATPEQEALDEARTTLLDLRTALGASPADDKQLANGRERLARKIANQETAIEELEVAALSSGSLRPGEVEDLRRDWRPKIDGPRVPFAGTMVDSELLRAAGLGEMADREVEKLG
ncbi:hypothetical protein ST47_g8375 [Ascochyta rabiei]|uniref:Arb2 domain-containing protein n=2 Tax=Didymella rabiei TaxID=5454 RepID=A0A162ZAZ2_DIDRA|nr:hypothetical protein ST47_g8375 [Ascochyta rabiei]